MAHLRLNIGGWLLLSALASFETARALATHQALPLFPLCCWLLLALHLLVMSLTLLARGVLVMQQMVRRRLRQE